MKFKFITFILLVTPFLTNCKNEVSDYIYTDIPPSADSFSLYSFLALLHEAGDMFILALELLLPVIIIFIKLLRKKIITDKITHYQTDRKKVVKSNKNQSINSVEGYRSNCKDYALIKDITQFKFLIEDEIDNIELKPIEARQFYLDKLQEIYNLDIQDKDDLKYAEFLFNNGDLRTEDEIFEYNKRLFGKEYSDSGKYDILRHSVNIFSFLIPFSITFAIVINTIPDLLDVWFIGLPIALLPSLFVGIIGMLIGYNHNVKQAKLLGISDSNPSVNKEKRKLVIGLTSGYIAARKGARRKKKMF